MKRIFFCFVFVLLVCSMVFAVSGVECVKNVDCSQSSCEVVSSLCEGGYCVFRAIGPKSCSDFEFPVCGNGFCEESEECKCPEDCQDVKPMIVKAPQIGSPDITINPTSFSDFEADVVFAVVNKDPEHKLEAFLHCKLPGNVEVSQTEGVDYLKGFVVSENFILDSAPGIHSMSFGLRSLDYGVKSIVCNINYVYFKEDEEGKQYVVDGKYKPYKIFQSQTETINVGKEQEVCDRKDRWKNYKCWSKSEWFLAGTLAVLLLIVLLFSIYKIVKNLPGVTQKRIIDDLDSAKKSFTTPYGYKYTRIPKKEFPGWAMKRFTKEVNKHKHPLSSGTISYHKGRNHRYLVKVGSIKKEGHTVLLPCSFYYRDRTHYKKRKRR